MNMSTNSVILICHYLELTGLRHLSITTNNVQKVGCFISIQSWPCCSSGRSLLASHCGNLGLSPGLAMWDLWWTK
jgi:hypothetical protein